MASEKITIGMYIYILDSHMAPYGACEAVQSKVRSSGCDSEGKISKAELSTASSIEHEALSRKHKALPIEH